jgi:hypothetical protein
MLGSTVFPGCFGLLGFFSLDIQQIIANRLDARQSVGFVTRPIQASTISLLPSCWQVCARPPVQRIRDDP